MKKTIDTVLQSAVADGDITGVAAIVADASGVLYQGAAGPRRSDWKEPIGPGDAFEIHSMTKPIATAGVMQLVEQGRLDLDADCGDLVPSLRNPMVLDGFDGDGKPTLRPAAAPVTLRRLLTHSSGFVYDQWNHEQKRWLEAAGAKRGDYYDDPAKCPPLAFDPGSKWEYGIGIDWAGKVLEAVAGQPLALYLKGALLDPLQMNSTGYVATDDIRKRLVGVHQRQPNGQIEPVDFSRPDLPPEAYSGGGGMFSTAEDYARFIRMILNDGELDGVRVLAADTVATMAQNHLEGDVLVRPLPSAIPTMTFPVDLYPGKPKGWGLSYMINLEDEPGARRAGTLSWAGLRNSYFWIDRTSGVGGAIFTQMLPFADPKTLAVYDRFERAVYAELH